MRTRQNNFRVSDTQRESDDHHYGQRGGEMKTPTQCGDTQEMNRAARKVLIWRGFQPGSAVVFMSVTISSANV